MNFDVFDNPVTRAFNNFCRCPYRVYYFACSYQDCLSCDYYKRLVELFNACSSQFEEDLKNG